MLTSRPESGVLPGSVNRVWLRFTSPRNRLTELDRLPIAPLSSWKVRMAGTWPEPDELDEDVAEDGIRISEAGSGRKN